MITTIRRIYLNSMLHERNFSERLKTTTKDLFALWIQLNLTSTARVITGKTGTEKLRTKSLN